MLLRFLNADSRAPKNVVMVINTTNYIKLQTVHTFTGACVHVFRRVCVCVGWITSAKEPDSLVDSP